MNVRLKNERAFDCCRRRQNYLPAKDQSRAAHCEDSATFWFVDALLLFAARLACFCLGPHAVSRQREAAYTLETQYIS